jgi:hypothetical protein
MNQDEIIEMAKEAGLHVANDSEGHFSGVTNEEMIDMYLDPDKERDRLFREKIFIEVLAPFAKLVAAKEREACAVIAEEWFCGCGRGGCPEGDRRAHDIADSIRARDEV